MRSAVLATQTSDEGKSLETIVFALLHNGLGSEDKLYYFREDAGECDFVVQRGNKVEELVQVCWELTKENRTREISGLLAASEATACRNCRIITFEQEETVTENGLTITVVPAWKL